MEWNENLRFSKHSREAFKFLRNVYGYNQYERRDGSIVSKVLVDGEVISHTKTVN